ncbi:hypothetical protein M7I_1820 [Glarea lozoyensis 74030]|uniref:Uncharacterized protein n=1 Tax=Glarea lozoyensis (strain ATCC 74030 / MF5533) TaxID=1104152 RepID=H0EGW2_GLAL7|nr:hypothetical protein M7I_1820 [Glarea lozoyensis 74030]
MMFIETESMGHPAEVAAVHEAADELLCLANTSLSIFLLELSAYQPHVLEVFSGSRPVITLCLGKGKMAKYTKVGWIDSVDFL